MKNLLLILTIPFYAFAQNVTISGKVCDSVTHKPIKNIRISVDGNLGDPKETNAEGEFKIVLNEYVNYGQVISIRCQDRDYNTVIKNLDKGNNYHAELYLAPKRNKPSEHISTAIKSASNKKIGRNKTQLQNPKKSYVWEDSLIWVDKNLAGIPFSQSFIINTENRSGIGAKNVDITFALDSVGGIITRIERSCTSPNNNNRCRLNFERDGAGNYPGRIGVFAKGYEGTSNYLPDCELLPQRNRFIYHRKWDGGPCTEVYTAYFTIPKTIKVKRLKT
ncbi:MAG: hypothetical protein JST58_04875 [Bacteroidetes bacterium]|nr:hypothetical protein [Bacteroidota bacterium]